MSEPSRTSPFRVSRFRDRPLRRSPYRGSVIFPKPAALGSGICIPLHFPQLSKPYKTSPDNAACSPHVPKPLVMSLRADFVKTSKAESSSLHDVPSNTLSDTILKREHLRHDLDETEIKLRNFSKML